MALPGLSNQIGHGVDFRLDATPLGSQYTMEPSAPAIHRGKRFVCSHGNLTGRQYFSPALHLPLYFFSFHPSTSFDGGPVSADEVQCFAHTFCGDFAWISTALPQCHRRECYFSAQRMAECSCNFYQRHTVIFTKLANARTHFAECLAALHSSTHGRQANSYLPSSMESLKGVDQVS